MPEPSDENAIDDGVEEEIRQCLRLDAPRSFFLYAGAGSGKTRSLVNALRWILSTYGRRLWLNGQHVGVITYTNAACDEIKERMEFNILIEVSTIHSFAWSLIGSYHSDIRNWLRTNLAAEIAELQAALAKGKPGTKAAIERASAIKSKTERLADIETVKAFQYSPTGENRGKDALAHAEVIGMLSSFMLEKPTLQGILVRRYPILLVDESQDTNRLVMDALLALQQKHKASFCLGLFGDMMQRIYADGKERLEAAIPADWAKPQKRMNHRCPGRVLRLLNHVRSEVDHQEQRGRTDKPDGVIRLFLAPANTSNKDKIEEAIRARMAESAEDELWKSDYKALTLEHHMAARRLGFAPLFETLAKVNRLRQGVLDGSLPGLTFFSKQVLPLVEALQLGDRFTAAAVARKFSPFMDRRTLATQREQIKQIGTAKAATDDLMALWREERNPTFGEVLDSIRRTGLFEIPDGLRVVADQRISQKSASDREDGEARDEAVEAWDEAMDIPFAQIRAYDRYVSGNSPFDTHQGVKGREFQRVMVVIDDEEARGFLFSYEKLFGVKEKSDTDRKNEQSGSETSIDRTRRLFYVTCSRAERSLAIVNYTGDPERAKANVIAAGWFAKDEVIIV
jgi:DNA helicase II / ATP-dependent DNA helicase PcrA